VGLELELQLLDGQTLDLRDGIVPLMEFYPDADRVRPELIQSSVEINSGKCETISELRDNLIVTARGLLDRCKTLGMALCGAGTHPFSRRLALITPKPRYLRIERQRGWLSHTQITYATHVHVGMKSAEQAATAFRRLVPSLPLLTVLSANSPYWRSYDTGHECYRQRLLAVTPNSGIPPLFANWGEFEARYQAAFRAGVCRSIKDIHWSARVHPDFGTIEIRNPDAQPTIAHAVALAGLIQTLAVYVAETPCAGLDSRLMPGLAHWVLRENQFRASQFGLDAEFLTTNEGATRPARAILIEFFDLLRPTAKHLGNGICLDALEIAAEQGLPYVNQRRDFLRHNSCRFVTERLVHCLEEDIQRACGQPRRRHEKAEP
jgi:carboxylate-amine ligase